MVNEGPSVNDESRVKERGSRPGVIRRYPEAADPIDLTATGAETWVVVNRLEGDVPGGGVDLCYRFTLSQDDIAELAIVA